MDRIGRYKIVRELGRGAMGIVYHAIDPNIGRPVAIKTIQLGDVRNSEEKDRLRERLFREARSAGILSHPGIVTIYDVEQQGDLAYIAMEFVDGPTLDQVMSGAEPLSPEQMFSILGQTANALDYAHGKGIVHRDIKPANIMIAADGTTKITDFGIAKITTSEQLTMTGSIVGTPHYMSPEQVQGQAVDGRSDQFSLAVISYEMLTGEKPYTGEHLTTVVYKIVAEEPTLPHRLNPSLNATIDAALRRALAKKPDQRYRTCSEFTEALEKACAASKNWKMMPRGGTLNEPTMADTPRPPSMLPPKRRPHSPGTVTTDKVRKKSGFLPFLAAVLMAAGLLGLIGWQAAPWLTGNSQAKKTPESQAAKQAANNPPSAAPITPAPQTAPDQPAAGPPQDKPAAQPDAPATQPAVAPAPVNPPPANLDDAKPSPMKKAPAEEARVPSAKPAAPRPSAPATQTVSITSSPGGATVTMDDRTDAVCRTPCELDAAPGHHRFSYVMPGYGVERREHDVGTEPLELPMVIFRAQTGMLALSSVPAGATVQVNGKRIDQVTPAMLQLTPGTYRITVEKDGRQGTASVDIRTGDTKTLRVTLGQ